MWHQHTSNIPKLADVFKWDALFGVWKCLNEYVKHDNYLQGKGTFMSVMAY